MRGRDHDPGAVLGDRLQRVTSIERALAHGLAELSHRPSLGSALRDELTTMRSDCDARVLTLGASPHALAADRPASSPMTRLLADARTVESTSEALGLVAAALGLAASEYAVLTQLAFRLFDPALRELAPSHLSAHLRASRRLHALLAGVVVHELDERELDCRCICPMCGLGACGCTLAGRATIDEAWPLTEVDLGADPGLDLTTPRRGSPLASAGALGGERLIAIDGEPIAAAGIEAVIEIQTAIRRHAIGEHFLVTVARADGTTRELSVEHVSDY